VAVLRYQLLAQIFERLCFFRIDDAFFAKLYSFLVFNRLRQQLLENLGVVLSCCHGLFLRKLVDFAGLVAVGVQRLVLIFDGVGSVELAHCLPAGLTSLGLFFE
jgi:hypothetical protein